MLRIRLLDDHLLSDLLYHTLYNHPTLTNEP